MAEETKSVEAVVEHSTNTSAAKPKKAVKAVAAKKTATVKKSASPAKTPVAPKVRKVKKTSAPSVHPPYLEMVTQAVTVLKERSGSSRQAILKYILANYQVCSNIDYWLVFLKSIVTVLSPPFRSVLILRLPIFI